MFKHRSQIMNIFRAAALGLALLLFTVAPLSAAGLRVATFRCDATPPLGDIMVWTVPLVKVETPLLAKGVVLEDGEARYVLCAVDWCLIGNESSLALRKTLAGAVRTRPERVTIHSIHQHDAPFADEGANRLMEKAPSPPPHLSAKFLEDFRIRLAGAAGEALARLEPFDRVGHGQAPVERVASARRLVGKDGKPMSRVSTGGKSKVMAEAPEGDIDRMIKTVTLAKGEKPLVRLHYYATHPQTVSCDGRATADFVGEAREAVEREEGVFQIYFTGCSGDVTVGKYNDTTTAAYAGLRERLRSGMKASIAATQYEAAGPLVWRADRVSLPLRKVDGFINESRAWLADPKADAGLRVYRGAMRQAFAERIARPIDVSSLQLGDIRILHLPGEPMLEYQKFAQRSMPDGFVAVAGYGDAGPAYICTDKAFEEGGYEPLAANTGPGSEAPLKAAIRRLLGLEAEAK